MFDQPSVSCHILQESGFSLIEMMIASVIIVVLIVFGGPHLSMAFDRQNRNSTTQALFRDLNHARTQALRLGTRVYLCPGNTGQKCGNSTHWGAGWTTFADYDNDRKPGENEILFRQTKQVFEKVRIGFRKPHYLFLRAMGALGRTDTSPFAFRVLRSSR